MSTMRSVNIGADPTVGRSDLVAPEGSAEGQCAAVVGDVDLILAGD